MKELNTYITEKLRINKDSKLNDEANGDTLDEVKYWVHNDWDGETSFLVSKKLSEKDINELIEYMNELEDNAKIEGEIHIYNYDDYNNKKYIIKVYTLLDNENN